MLIFLFNLKAIQLTIDDETSTQQACLPWKAERGDRSCLSSNLSSGPRGSVAMSATDNENTHDSNNFLSFPSHLCTFGAFPALSSAAVTFQSWLEINTANFLK